MTRDDLEWRVAEVITGHLGEGDPAEVWKETASLVLDAVYDALRKPTQAVTRKDWSTWHWQTRGAWQGLPWIDVRVQAVVAFANHMMQKWLAASPLAPRREGDDGQ